MEFSDNAKYWLRKLGNFGVTSSGKEIKGWALLDNDDEYERVYFSAEDLRKLANAANEVADKLESGLTKRAPDLKPACPTCKDTGSVEYPCPNCRPSRTASSG